MPFRITAVGSPLVDYNACVDDAFLQKFVPGAKGGTIHITDDEKNAICERLNNSMLRTCGGSAANTAFALAKLGVETAFVGKLGKDPDGEYFLNEMTRCNLDGKNIIVSESGSTGYCISLVTPDAERTMRSNLGVSTGLTAGDFSPGTFEGSDWVHIEGYMAECDAFETMLECARSAGCKIGLDLSSFELAESHRELFTSVLESGKIDLIFANSEEAIALTGCDDDEKNLQYFAKYCTYSVLKLGSRGALVINRDENDVYQIAAEEVFKVVDTTAAGDFFAAGFYFGLSNESYTCVCGRCGAIMAAEIIQHFGTVLPEEYWMDILWDVNSEVIENVF